jgi:hypothetical protein
MREPTGPTTPPAVAPAVSRNLRARKEATVVDEETILKVVADASFRRDEEGRWVDTRWDGKTEPKRIEAYSEEYFALVDEDPVLAKYLALGERVVFLWKGRVYEVAPKES